MVKLVPLVVNCNDGVLRPPIDLRRGFTTITSKRAFQSTESLIFLPEVKGGLSV